jgi:hypothetical protein
MMNNTAGAAGAKILACNHIEGYPVYYRASTGSAIKYLEVLDTKDVGFRYGQFQQAPLGELPDGDWNIAELVHDGLDNDKLIVASVERKTLTDVMDAWSGIKVDYESLGERLNATEEEALQLDHYLEFSRLCPGPAEVGVPRVLAFVEPWYHAPSVLANENTIRRIIQDAGVSTRVLGHLTENGGQVIGIC